MSAPATPRSSEPAQPPAFDVAVIGLGPVGTTLAALLGRRGLRVGGFDRELDVFPLPRAGHIDHMGLRTLQEIGCLDALLPRMIPNRGLELRTAAGELLASIPGDQRSPSGLPASMYFHQPDVDRAVRDAAAALPTVELHTGVDVVGFEPAASAVALRTIARDGRERTVDAAYVVACDGAGGTARAALGIANEDLDFKEPWVVVDLELERPIATVPDRAVTVCDPRRPHAVIGMPGNRCRLEFMALPGEDPETLVDAAVFQPLLDPWIPAGAARVARSAVYTFNGLVAERWRAGRVLLAGDAAHLMPPVLGQGMCSGLRDATNLAWKLDLVLRGLAREAILDTYEAERRPHVREIVEAAVRIGRVLCTTDEQAAAERDRELLSNPAAAARLAFRLPSLEPGPLVREGGGELFVQPPASAGQRLDDVVGQRFLVLARTPAALGASGAWWATEVGALVETLATLADADGLLERWLDRHDADVVVVRPDRYVLAAGGHLDAITAPLRALLGRPAPDNDSSSERPAAHA